MNQFDASQEVSGGLNWTYVFSKYQKIINYLYVFSKKKLKFWTRKKIECMIYPFKIELPLKIFLYVKANELNEKILWNENWPKKQYSKNQN